MGPRPLRARRAVRGTARPRPRARASRSRRRAKRRATWLAQSAEATAPPRRGPAAARRPTSTTSARRSSARASAASSRPAELRARRADARRGARAAPLPRLAQGDAPGALRGVRDRPDARRRWPTRSPGSFEADGTLADRASPRLRELRGEWHAARQRMLSRMEELMSRYEAVLQDRFVTEREGRWVLPVRSRRARALPGHRPRDEQQRGDAVRRAARGRADGQPPQGARGRGEARGGGGVRAADGARSATRSRASRPRARALALADVRAATAKLARDLALVFPERRRRAAARPEARAPPAARARARPTRRPERPRARGGARASSSAARTPAARPSRSRRWGSRRSWSRAGMPVRVRRGQHGRPLRRRADRRRRRSEPARRTSRRSART